MSGFSSPALLWLGAATLVFWWLFSRVQRRALDWIEAHVALRFRGRITAYGSRSLRIHLGLLLMMALALVVAAAGPYSRGETETVTATGRLLLLVDGSASMWADDVQRPESRLAALAASAANKESQKEEADNEEADNEETGSGKFRRIDYARHVALTLMSELEGFRFALGSFSGTGVVHLPMTTDARLIERALDTFEVHSYYRNTGSSFASALDLVPHFVDRRGYRLQVVLLSDGEQPVEDDYGAQLAALAEQGVPVHTVAFGSTQGQSRRIFKFQDVVDKKESPEALAEFHTRRVDRHLKSISRATGGSFFVAEEGVIQELTGEILEAGLEVQPFEHQAARSDLSGRFLALFLAGLVFDTLIFGRRPRSGPVRFELDRLISRAPGGSGRTGKPVSKVGSMALAPIFATAALSALGLLFSCSLPFGAADRGSPRELAHRENERGIVKDGLRRHTDARTHYERSRGYEVEPEIPAYNLARSVLLTGDYSEAHDLFQEALLLDPDLSEAHFNDAMTLYLWGAAERDPKDCELERARELWSQALRRFSSAREAGAGEEIGDRARVNRAVLAEQLDEVDRLIAEPPEACRGESSEAESESGGGESESGGEGAASGGGGTSEEGEAGQEGGDGEQEEEAEEREGEEAQGEEGEDREGEDQQGEDEEPAESESGDEPEDGDTGDGETSEGEGGSGQAQPEPGNTESQGGGSDLTESELEEIRQQLELLAQQGREAGKYHRRTLPEQFRKSDWSNPEATIWW